MRVLLNKRVFFVLIVQVIFFLIMQHISKDSSDQVPEKPGGEDMKLSSSAFASQGNIPMKYTCQGDDINPPLVIEDIPQEAKSLVLLVHDPDAPSGDWVHWVVWNIPVTSPTVAIPENTQIGVEGVNDFGKHSYGGPCPPYGVHHYYFEVYALNTMLDLPLTSQMKDVKEAIKGKVIAQAVLIGLYEKQ